MLRSPALVLFVLFGCPGPDVDTGKDSDTGGGYVETGDVVDSGDTSDTGETGDTDTGDTDTDDTDTGVEPGLAALDAWPTGIVVNAGASWALRVVGESATGDRAVYTGATFSSDDTAVATVDAAGVVTAVAPGSTTLRVSAEGLEVVLAVEVTAAQEATVTVRDASGAPIEKARVFTDDTEYKTDAAGAVTLPVSTAGPATFTVWKTDDLYAVTVVETVNRSFTVTLAPTDTRDPDAELHGAVDFSGLVEPSSGEESFGLAAGSVQGPLTLFDIEDLLGEDRTLVYYGVDVAVPSNVFVKDYLDDYYASVFAGPVAVWGLGGPVPIAELAAGLNGTGDAMALLIDHLADLRWGWSGGLTATTGATTEAPLAPAVAFSDSVHVALPSLPAGFEGTEEQLVCTFDDTADGWVLTGLGLGSGVLDVSMVPDGSVSGATGGAVWTMAQVGGLGSGPTGTAVSVGYETGSATVTFPDFQDIPAVTAWDNSSRVLDFTADADSTFVRVRMVDPQGRSHDLYLDGGSWSGLVDKHNDDFRRPSADITVQSFTVLDGTFEHWVATDTLDPAGLDASTVSSFTYFQ